MAKRFVKAGDTRTPVSNSRNDLERILKRYGANAFSVASDYETGKIIVAFRVPDQPGGPASVPVRLEASIEHTAAILYGPLKGSQVWRESALQQAERVAWRHLVLWVDAALSAANAGLQTASEAFFAHVVVRGAGGENIRLVELVNQVGGGEWQKLLPVGRDPL